MRFRLLHIFVVAVCAGCNGSEPAPDGLPKPWITISENNYDFGVIPHGEARTHVFYVTNQSRQRIRLTGIRNQCTCAVLEQRVLRGDTVVADRPIHWPPRMVDGGFLVTWVEPGERLELTVRVDTSRRPPLDHHEQAISELYFEPGEVGKVTLGYKFRIQSRVMIKTDQLATLNPTVNLGEYSKHQTAFGFLEIGPRKGQAPFKIVAIRGTDERLTLEPEKAGTQGAHRWLVKLAPNGTAGPFARDLEFQTNLPGDYVVRIAVRGNAVPNLQFVPAARLDFNRFDFARPRETFVTLRYRKPGFDPAFSIGRIEVKDGKGKDLSARFEARIDGGTERLWTLHLRYSGGAATRRFSGWVQLRSQDPEHRSTIIRFQGFNSGAVHEG